MSTPNAQLPTSNAQPLPTPNCQPPITLNQPLNERCWELGVGSVGRWQLGVGNLRSFVRRRDDGLHAASYREIADDSHAPWLTGLDEIVEDRIRRGLEEDAAIAKPEHVVLQRFQLDAAVRGHVRDADFAEVGQAGFWTNGGELRAVDRDLEAAFRTWIRKCLDRHLA